MGENKKKKNNHFKHMLLMMIGCLIPVILIVALSKSGVVNLSGGLYWIIFLICPIMHIFMMKGMHQNHKEDCEDKSLDIQERE
ncbi:DUF2933 domain-containing protein [Sporosalibacterium faouarense]|uniref:DUF2933 domain-containing protein n=1 Tax=Sporosalibacterium faouarense TaxID=516123 RepID=UPI00141C090F|nr:DUF2933 domain-containing protein [Sporosalibacterium faouarense]MTI48541.1 DUF2933 domain-containing protein [Bacillota bacterium]